MECLGSQYYDPPTQLCKACHESCHTCSGPGPFSCSSCLAPLHLDRLNNQCVPCCTQTGQSDCCTCDPTTGGCQNSSPAGKRRIAAGADPLEGSSLYLEQQSTPAAHQSTSFTTVTALAVGGCVAVVVLFGIIFAVLQVNSHMRRTSWRRGEGYEKLPKLDNTTTSVSMAHAECDLTEEEEDDERQLFTKT